MNNKNLSSKDFTTIILVAATIAFVLTSLLSAGYLALYHFLRDHFGLGFWQVVFLYAAVVTVFSAMSVVNKSSR